MGNTFLNLNGVSGGQELYGASGDFGERLFFFDGDEGMRVEGAVGQEVGSWLR